MPLPSKHSMHEQKAFSELITDPHFLFTLLSLFASIAVFFYYLFQLLFRTNDFRATGTYTPPSRRNSGQKPALDAHADSQQKEDSKSSSKVTSKTSSPSAMSQSELAVLLADLRERGERRKGLLRETAELAPKAAADEAADIKRATVEDEPEEIEAGARAVGGVRSESPTGRGEPNATIEATVEAAAAGSVSAAAHSELRRRKTASSRREE